MTHIELFKQGRVAIQTNSHQEKLAAYKFLEIAGVKIPVQDGIATWPRNSFLYYATLEERAYGKDHSLGFEKVFPSLNAFLICDPLKEGYERIQLNSDFYALVGKTDVVIKSDIQSESLTLVHSQIQRLGAELTKAKTAETFKNHLDWFKSEKVGINVLTQEEWDMIQLAGIKLGIMTNICVSGRFPRVVSYSAKNDRVDIFGDLRPSYQYNFDTVTDFLKAPIPNASFERELSVKYTAVITKETVTVGCQTFKHENVQRLVDAVAALKK